MAIRNHRDLEVWQKAMQLAEACYRLSVRFPREEQFCLALQLRRSAVSIPANIAEGRGRRRTREFLRFLDIAYGSLAELETCLELAEQLGYLAARDTEPIFKESASTGRLLNGLINALKTRIRT